MSAVKDLLSSAMTGGSISRYGDMAVLALPNMGMVTTQRDLQQAQAWARSRMGSAAVHKDRQRLVDRLETVIGRNGSGCATRGAHKELCSLVAAMKRSGMDLDSWMIPKAVMDELFPPHNPAGR